MLSIALIDIIGLTYDGTTLSKRGLGGSESAIILMSKELAAIGFDVTVFNNCIDKEASEGVYDNVKYIDISKLDTYNNYKFDIVISSRTVIPFLPRSEWGGHFAQYSPARFGHISNNAACKIVWLHDTFCNGDHLLEPMLTQGFIHEIFTLSDFHTSYVSTCDHNGKRMFEVLKNKIFQTRNGVVNYKPYVDISAKDPFLCVYNASVTKGMLPLVERIWPRIKREIPQAKLKVIGGYYRFRENAAPDAQEVKWRELVADPKYTALDVEFTGIIKQNEIAEILSKSSYMLFPGAFPETFGISSLESLTYNTPLVTTRFGALEETAVNQACYLIDYPIEANGLFPNINNKAQEDLFVATAIRAMQDKHLHQQKMYSCNLVKDISSWGSVALQWKQHLYKIFGANLAAEEFKKVSYINYKVRKVFGRRFCNYEDNYVPSLKPEQKILIVTPVYNSELYIAKCIESVITQDYNNWEMIIIDDKSTDKTLDVIKLYNHPNIKIYANESNVGAVKNQVLAIRAHAEPEDIVMLLDGDDSLINDNQIFTFYNNTYDGNTEFTYGSCWSMIDSIPLIAQPYPPEVLQNKTYRQHLFNWNMPYTHLRTFKAHLLLDEPDQPFLDENGNWYKAGGDCSVFYTALENANPNKVKAISDIVYNYNDTNPINDYKVNGSEQTKNANRILGKTNSNTKADKFSVIVPTMWRCPEFVGFLTQLVDNELIGEVIIINNDVTKTPKLPANNKIVLVNCDKNIFVNPAWNLGASLSRFEKLCIVNDDIRFDLNVFSKVSDFAIPNNGVTGLCPGKEQFGQPLLQHGTINIIPWKNQHTFGFGCLMFLHKNNWVDIPEGLNIYYGDNFIFDNLLSKHKTNYLITDIKYETKWATTTSDLAIVEGKLDEETPIYRKLAMQNFKLEKEEKSIKMIKNILIAVPTNKGIEPDTFKAIYDLEIPEGYTSAFHYYYGYQIDQIRNLIAEWGKHFDYLFCVDSDISFAPDTLKKLLAHNTDIVAGIYIQRRHGQHTLEVYKGNRNVDISELVGKTLVEVDACGFGCILINSRVLNTMEYPHFVYKSAIDHRETLSEDVYFCLKAREKGFKTYVDPSVVCDHHGSYTFKVMLPTTVVDPVLTRFKELEALDVFPKDHVNYLKQLKQYGVEPNVIYDIGSCVLHWTDKAQPIWPNAKIIAFEAMDEVEPLYKERGLTYNLGVLSDRDNKEVEFYQNSYHPGGNSYFKEDVKKLIPNGMEVFTEDHKRKKIAMTLDTIIKSKNLPLPDMIKIDTQGAEMDILKGATLALSQCKHLILELQRVEYNIGAPLRDEVIAFVENLGFKLVKRFTSDQGVDADHHFVKLI